MASLSTCHLELVVWDGNLVKSNSASSMPARTMFKGGRPAKAVWEHFVSGK